MTQTTKKISTPPPIVLILGGAILLAGFVKLGSLIPKPHLPGMNPVQERLSIGSRLLILGNTSAEKEAGVQAFAAQDYVTAEKQFELSLSKRRNDPESWIYLNNARLGGKPTLKIAVSVPIGSNLNVAQEILRGVAQAQDAINRAGGINGSGLQVEIANDENDPELAKAIASEFVKDAQVLAVVGHNASDASITAAPIYQQGQLVMVSPTSTSNQLSGFGTYIFRTIPATRFLAEPLAQYVVKTARRSRIATCFDSQAKDNIAFKDEFVASLIANGGSLISIDCDLAATTFNPKTAIAQAISSGAEGILLIAHIDRLERAIALARANQSKLALFSSSTLYTITTLQSGQGDVSGMVLPVIWHPKQKASNSFPIEAKRYWGGTVNWRTATAYDATQAIATGLNQIPTRPGLQAVLRNPTFSAIGSGEPIKFLPSGDRLSTPSLIQIQPTASGYDFVPIKTASGYDFVPIK
jgi:branched-chain amino acid transport system substrate-binding protein